METETAKRVAAPTLEEFIAEMRCAVDVDPMATVRSPDGREILASEFLANYDRQKAEREA